MLALCAASRLAARPQPSTSGRKAALAPVHPRPGRARTPLPPRVWPFDLAWGTSLPTDIDSQALAANLFAASIFPYAGFLYHLQKSKAVPGLTLFGFYFLLVFVAATIPAGIYAKVHYGAILADVDWLHGSAEALLTMTNLFIVIGLRRALKEARSGGQDGGACVGGGAVDGGGDK